MQLPSDLEILMDADDKPCRQAIHKLLLRISHLEAQLEQSNLQIEKLQSWYAYCLGGSHASAAAESNERIYQNED